MAKAHHVVVDGSNLATEGRTLPSLKQLDEAVRAYAEEDPTGKIIVVVDATFEHRISDSERKQVREAMLNGELVSPPAGAIGRGDAFVLRIAERTGAIVVSNDSFQEFHGQHPWLFDEGRLIGGKPVPGVGWIFTPRLPIRGPKSRAATEVAKAVKKATKKSTTKAPSSDRTWPLTPTTPPPRTKSDRALAAAIGEATAEALDPAALKKAPAKKRSAQKATVAEKSTGPVKAPAKQAKRQPSKKQPARSAKSAKKDVTKKGPAAAVAKKEPIKKGAPAKKAATKKAAPIKPVAKKVVTAPKKSSNTRSPAGKKGEPRKKAPSAANISSISASRQASAAVNAPLAFINFVSAYSVKSEVQGTVVSFTSHGAMIDVAVPKSDPLHCYIPLTGMGDPPPAKARQVLKKGETRRFVIVSIDTPRRVAELALPVAPKKRTSRARRARATA